MSSLSHILILFHVFIVAYNIVFKAYLPVLFLAMGIVSFLRKVYDHDTLDTRFLISTSTPYKTVIEARDDPVASKERAAKRNSKAHTSRWNTPEFYLYYAILLWVIPYMFWVGYDSSRRMLYTIHKAASIIYTN